MSIHTVILSYNHPEITARCLQSVLRHCSADDVSLVHNGSQAKFVAKLKADFSSIRHLQLDENRGFAGGTNFALNSVFEGRSQDESIKNDWVLFITNDCELLSVGDLPKQPGLYAPLIYFRGTGRVDSIMGRFDPTRARLEHIKSSDNLHGRVYVPGTSFLIHRDVFLKVGGFDESLFTYWEDVDFSQRVHECGFPVEHDPGFSLLHRVGKTCHKHSYYTSYLYHRNRRLVSRRYCPWPRRPQLETELFGAWIKHSLSLARKKRWSDMRMIALGYWRDELAGEGKAEPTLPGQSK